MIVGGMVFAVSLAACGSSVSSGHSSPPPTSRPRTAQATQPAHTAQRSSSPTGGVSRAAATALVTIESFAYRVPKSVDPGAKVSVKNMDQVAHTVTADASDSLFNVTVDPGGTATFTAPSKPGPYKFHCTFHSNMHSTLVVK
jgi:plastocyanin